MAGNNSQKKKLHSGRHASAIKRARQNPKRRRYNRGFLKEMRAAIKGLRVAIASSDKAQAQSALKTTIPVVAKTARRGIIPKGRASRYISRLTHAVNRLSA